MRHIKALWDIIAIKVSGDRRIPDVVNYPKWKRFLQEVIVARGKTDYETRAMRKLEPGDDWEQNRCLPPLLTGLHIRHRLDDLLRILFSIHPLLIASLDTGHTLVLFPSKASLC